MGSKTAYRRIGVCEVNGVTVVRFRNQRLNKDDDICELGQELFRLVEVDGVRRLLLNFDGVTIIASGALGKLITLHKKMGACGGVLKLSNIRPESYQAFITTKLNELFDIKDDEAGALAAF